MKFLNKLSLLLITLVMPLSLAAGQLRGGGDGVDENGQWILLDMIEIYDLEPMSVTSNQYFKTEFLPRYKVALDHCSYPFFWFSRFQKQINGVAERLDSQVPNGVTVFSKNNYLQDNQQFYKITEGKMSLGKYPPKEISWFLTDKDLEEIPDEGAVKLPSENLEKKQLAIQQNGIVIIYRPIFEKLSDRDKAALIFHEIALSMQMIGNSYFIEEHGTVDIRRFVQFIFKLQPGAEFPFSTFEQFCGWKGSFFNNLSYATEFHWSGPSGNTHHLEMSLKR